MTEHTKALAARRKALISECALQRITAVRVVREMTAPSGEGRQFSIGNIKVPLTIAGVVLGMIATKRGSAMPMITAGYSLYKLLRSALAVLRRPST